MKSDSSHLFLDTIGKRLQYLRYLSRLSRSAIKDRLGIAESTLKAWENKNNKINKTKLENYVRDFKKVGIQVNLDWVITGKGDLPSNIIFSEYLHSNLLKQPVEKNNALPFVAHFNNEEQPTSINKSFASLLNLPNNNQSKLKDLINTDNYKVCKPFLDNVLIGFHVSFDFPWLTNNDQYIFVNINLFPSIDDKNEISGFFFFMEEINPFLDNCNSHFNFTLPTYYDEALYIKVTKLIIEYSGNVKSYDYNLFSKLHLQIYSYFQKLGRLESKFVNFILSKVKLS